MLEICKYESCTGCRLCAAVCPRKSISFSKYIYGHYYPVIDKTTCIDCKLCKKNCIANQEYNQKKNIEQECYAAWCKNDREHYESSSGGLATLISREILRQGGKVFGCLWDDDLNAIHVGIESEHDLDKLRKSKYTLSQISPEVFKNLKYELLKGRFCVFIGVGCQCDAVRKYLKKDYDNLLVIDLLCRGGASSILLKEHIEYLITKYKLSKINNITFRGGAYDCCIALRENNDVKYYGAQYVDEYFKSFMAHVIFRKSCFNCKYANSNRVGDITLADFWGLDKKLVKKYDLLKRGVNLLLINTEKGRVIIDKIKDKIYLIERDINEAIDGNETLCKPTSMPQEYEKFWKYKEKYNFEESVHRTYYKFYISQNHYLKKILKAYFFLRNSCSLLIKK